MRCFFAIDGRTSRSGSLMDCLAWGTAQVTGNPNRVVKVLMARPGEKEARIVFEVTADGYQAVTAGRVIPTKLLMRAAE